MARSIVLLSPGKTRETYLNDGISVYERKIQHFHKLKIELIDLKSTQKGKTPEAVVQYESLKIMERLERYEKPVVILLHESGKQYDSVAFAARLQKQLENPSDIIFVIGGPFGISKELKSKASEIMSLSKMTFLHEMTRIILLEQIYRAFQINSGTDYHK